MTTVTNEKKYRQTKNSVDQLQTRKKLNASPSVATSTKHDEENNKTLPELVELVYVLLCCGPSDKKKSPPINT